jgi:hypothetical protein
LDFEGRGAGEGAGEGEGDGAGEGEGASEGEDDALPASVLPLWVMTHPSGGESRIAHVVNDDGFVTASMPVPPAITSPHGLAVDPQRNRLLVIGFGEPGEAGLWTIDLRTGEAAPLNKRLQGSGIVVKGGRIFVVAEERFLDDEGLVFQPLSLHEVDPVSGDILSSRPIHGMSCALDLAVLGDDLVYTCDRIIVRLDDNNEETFIDRRFGDGSDNIYAATRFDDRRTLFVEASGRSWIHDGRSAVAGPAVPVAGWITAIAVP